MKKGQTIAASVVGQAKKRALRSSETTNLENNKILISYVDRTPDPSLLTPRLRVLIPDQSTFEIHDFSNLLVQQELAFLLAEGFRCWAAGVSRQVRINARRRLNGFADFFASWPALQLSRIDGAFWNAILRFINAPKKNGQPLSHSSRSLALQSITSPIRALLNHPIYDLDARYLCYQSGLPNNPWPGKAKKVIPTATLSPTERDQLILACLREVTAARERFRESEQILKDGHSILKKAQRTGMKPDFAKDIGACAAFIEKCFPDKLVLLTDLWDLDKDLYWAVRKHSMFQVRRLLYSSFRDLVPFILLIGVKTAFNPETLLTLKWANMRYSYDGKLISIIGEKKRQNSKQSSTIEAENVVPDTVPFSYHSEPHIPDGFGGLLSTLSNITARTRRILANSNDADKLFVGIPKHSGTAAKAFGDSKFNAVTDITWKFALTNFIKENGLKPFTLQMIRPTEGEVEYLRTGGDLKAVQSRLGHKTVQTTRTFYTSDWMRRGGQDRIAETQELYIRWAATDGLVDPRGKEAYSQGAATPGFMCLDPYASPRAGQHIGKLCTAYGECPSCPLAAAKPQDPQTVALYLGLYKAIFAGQQGRISGQGWIAKWIPILHDLSELLKLVPEDVKSSALLFRVHLKPVG